MAEKTPGTSSQGAKSKCGSDLKVGDKVSVEFEVTGVSGNSLSLTGCDADSSGAKPSLSCESCCVEKCDPD